METSSMVKRVWTRVSGDGKSAAAGMSLGSGGGSGSGTKTGAGGKPQPYGWHGYYGETGGGSSSGPEYRGRVTLPHEARGKVTPPVQKGKVVTPPPPAPLSKGGRVGVSTKNDVPGKQGPDPEALHPETREQVQSVLDKNSATRDVNMNSAYRSGDGVHGEGRAVDINRINGQKISDAVDPNVPAEQREAMCEQLKEIRSAAKANPDVEAYIDPLGGFFRPKDRNSKEEGREANVKEKYDHRHHIHITIRKVLQTRQ